MSNSLSRLIDSRLAMLFLPTALVFFALSCGNGPASPPTTSRTTGGPNLGPLAMVAGTDIRNLAGGGSGPIHIDRNCVTMTSEAGQVLILVWRSDDELLWNEGEEAITYMVGQGAAAVTLREGDIITVGGRSLGDEAPNTEWLATPAPACEGKLWRVDGLTTD